VPKAVKLRFPRPATGFRRRSFAFGAGVLALAWVLPASVDQSVARRPFDPASARAAAFRARNALREPAPAAARQVDQLISQAEIVTADERTAPVWEQNPGRVEGAWSRALAAGRTALVEVRLGERGFAERWREAAQRTESDVRNALLQSNEAGVGRREIAAARQAELKWQTAERFARDGHYDRALAEADAARSFAGVVQASYTQLHSRFQDPKNRRYWRRLADEMIARSKSDRGAAFLIDKLNRKLHVYVAGTRVATFTAELGAKGLNRKLHSGDQATPEGHYRVTEVRGPGRTKYYKALMLDYPNAEDRARFAYGRKSGQVPLRAGIGSLIEIHGDGGQGRDWTDGCVALANRDMDKVFARARVGTPVTIVGAL
jgi:L,D-peptidoglycan transpeptidase YkuD (ErfK/YbiS/YcfS/YnhG family)